MLIQRGIEYQYNATTAEMAERAFKKSCDICATTGWHIECDRCKISAAHNLVMSIFKSNKTA